LNVGIYDGSSRINNKILILGIPKLLSSSCINKFQTNGKWAMID
jgi:hypothetical protein